MTSTEHGGIGETTVVAQAAAAHPEAFDALHRRHGEAAWRLAVAVSGDRDDAAAIVPEAFATVFTGIKAGRISPEADFRTELLGSVRNAALDLARHRRDTDEAPAHAPSTHEHLLGRAFAELPERWRTTLWLTVVEDVAPGSVAPVVELSPHETAQLAGRARRGLHEQFLNAHLAETGDRNCARAIPRLSAHAAGELDEDDREKLDRHLSLCDACTDRRRQLDDLAGRLAVLAPPLPDDLAEPTRSAWSAAVAPTKARTTTGLSPATEKLLAGVSAVAAAAGVVGAAMLGSGGNRGTSTAQARPVSPAAATETDEPQPLELDPGVDIPTLDAGTSLGSTGSGSSSSSGGRSVFGASTPTSGRTAAGSLGTTTTTSPPTTAPVAPKTSTPTPAPTTTAPPEEPAVSVGTNVGDTPVAVEIGSDPGITVGPITLGSEPEPGESPIELGGPLAPVGEVVEDVTGSLGLGGLLGG